LPKIYGKMERAFARMPFFVDVIRRYYYGI